MFGKGSGAHLQRGNLSKSLRRENYEHAMHPIDFKSDVVRDSGGVGGNHDLATSSCGAGKGNNELRRVTLCFFITSQRA